MCRPCPPLDIFIPLFYWESSLVGKSTRLISGRSLVQVQPFLPHKSQTIFSRSGGRVDTTDLKSVAYKRAWGFESPLRYQNHAK